MTAVGQPAPTPVHYLRGNAKEWSPAHLIVMDTETASTPTDRGELLTMSHWAARALDRRPRRKGQALRDESANGTRIADLVRTVDQWTRDRRATWLYAHNVGFDLMVTRLPIALAEAGWDIGESAVSSESPWFRLSNGDRRLVITDSWSVFPRPLEELARMVGMRKLSAPITDPASPQWERRCRHDVDILAAVLVEAMDWWDEQEAGQWSITGPSTGWHAYRHKHRGAPILIDPDETVQNLQRAASYGGRRYVRAVGRWDHGRYVEIDFTGAYPAVVATLGHPRKVGRHFDSLPLDTYLLTDPTHTVIADVEIDTDEPRWPVKHAGRVWYPVGRFTTRLMGPEIREARELGTLRAILTGEVHKIGVGMRPWANWCLDVASGAAEGTPQVASVMAKNWSRSVLGNFAARSTETVDLGEADRPGWHLERCWNPRDMTHGHIVSMAGRRTLVRKLGAGVNAYPAVYAWVESHVRVRLSRMIAAVGPEAVVQANTDGVIVDAALIGTPGGGGEIIAPAGLHPKQRLAYVLEALAPYVAPLNARVKSTHRTVEVHGPAAYIIGAERRVAGLPRQASLISDARLAALDVNVQRRLEWAMQRGGRVYDAMVWPGFAEQLTSPATTGYERRRHVHVVGGANVAGWVLDSGRVLPVEFDQARDGTNTFVNWHRSGVIKRPGDTLGPEQPRELEGWH